MESPPLLLRSTSVVWDRNCSLDDCEDFEGGRYNFIRMYVDVPIPSTWTLSSTTNDLHLTPSVAFKDQVVLDMTAVPPCELPTSIEEEGTILITCIVMSKRTSISNSFLMNKKKESYCAPRISMMGTDPSMDLKANREAIAIIAALPFFISTSA